MKKVYSFLFVVYMSIGLIACNKDTASNQADVLNSLLSNKNWYLDYTISGAMTSTVPVIKSYVGQSTYFVTYLKDGTTTDSDGLTGTYTVEIVNNQSQIHVQLKTSNGNPLEVIYDIISVGEAKLVLSKVITSGNPTKLYFSSK